MKVQELINKLSLLDKDKSVNLFTDFGDDFQVTDCFEDNNLAYIEGHIC